MKKQSELVRALRKELAAKEKELADQKWVFEQFLQSPTWRATAPVRWLANRLRNLKNGQTPSASVSTPKEHDAGSVDTLELEAGSELKAAFTSLHKLSLESFLSSNGVLDLPHSEQPTISILLVLFNRAELTLACLRSVAEYRTEGIEVVIVDNASSDSTPRLLERIRGARILRNPENRHFVLGVNQAARECRGEYILVLNNDAQLLPGALDNLIATIRTSEDIGAVGGKIILLDGSLQEAGSIVWQGGSCTGYGRGDDPMSPMYNFRRDVDYCSGAFILTRRKTWEQFGGFDEAFKPFYYEETDYCMRLWQSGLRVVYEPRAAIIHHEFASSESMARATSLQAAHQSLFAARYSDVLAKRDRPDAERLLHARSHDSGRRVLFIDDRVPHLWLGSGFPRANALLRALRKHGCFVTLYPLAVVSEPWDVVYSDIPEEVEAMMGWGAAMLESFMRSRKDYYSTIIISRPHNMEWVIPLVKAHPDWFESAEIIYDAEALFASREVGLRKLAGNPMTEEETREIFAKEVRLASAADLVVAVSESEGQAFATHGIPRVEVLGHSIDIAGPTKSFEDRSGFLFVGAVHEENSPNGDSLIWFLSEIFPKVRALLGDALLTIAGVNQSERVKSLAGPGVVITGHLPSLAALYDNSRVFIAPTRYAAGIPHKVHEAAAHGLPVVATPLLVSQLGWSAREVAVGEDAETFAARCVDVYSDPAKWTALRDAAALRVREECSPASFEGKVARLLGNKTWG